MSLVCTFYKCLCLLIIIGLTYRYISSSIYQSIVLTYSLFNGINYGQKLLHLLRSPKRLTGGEEGHIV